MKTASLPMVENEQPSAAGRSELDVHASGFMVRVEGNWTPAALAQFRHYLRLRRLSPPESELLASLERAREEYLRGSNRLYLCGAEPCCSGLSFDRSSRALAAASRMAGLPICETGCQGQCKRAPLLAVRIADRTQMFARVTNGEAWLAVLTFIRSAVKAGTLLIDPGDAEPFLHDPVHEHAKPDARLKALRFLLGHFRGEGRCALNNYMFQKEVMGSIEAGGRFISLRMDASYPLADGRRDVHRALVIVGAKPASRNMMGCAYTDAGRTCEYEVEPHEDGLRFADAAPDHTGQWKRTRKILKPTREGFEERLEVDAGNGFIPYYTIAMRKTDAV